MGTTPTNSESSSSQVTSQINGVAREVQALQTTQIFKDDTGTRRVLLGRGADGFYGLKVSQEGIDVYDAANDDLVFNSNQNVFKIVTTGTTTVSTTGPTDIGTVEVDLSGFNLSNPPVVFAFIGDSALYNPLPSVVTSSFSGGNFTIQDYIYVTQITASSFWIFFAKASSGTASYTIRYYVLQETAN